MPIPRSSAKEFFTECKERSFLNPGEDEMPQDFNILTMLLNLLAHSSRSNETSHHSTFVTYTIIEIASVRSTDNPTLVLVENRISQRRERNSNNSLVSLSVRENNDENLNNLIF